MEPDERLTALKKAYADIIFNTSKEAAARVMVSERKAARYKHELQQTKEEALRMLLRLKQMMNSKISEAEAASLIKQKKIEELEAQLEEAEDIVKDLREELGEVQAELDRVKSSYVEPCEPNAAYPTRILGDDRVYVSQPIELLQKLKNESTAVLDMSTPHLTPQYSVNQELPSIILRSKEPTALHRKACTQRIHACERNMFEQELSIPQKTKQACGEIIVGEFQEGTEDGKGLRTGHTHGAETHNTLEKKLLADIKFNNLKSFRWKKKKRAMRGRKDRRPLDLPSEGAQTSQTSGQNLDKDICFGKHTLNVAPRVLSDNAEPNNQSGYAAICQKQLESVKSYGDQSAICKNEGLVKGTVLMRRETTPIDSLEIPSCKADTEKVDMPQLNLESKSSYTTKGVPSSPATQRTFKYTFQRKRKRQALVGANVNVSLETDVLKEKDDKENGPNELEVQDSSLVADSSQDAQRLEEVARQLISLSGKW